MKLIDIDGDFYNLDLITSVTKNDIPSLNTDDDCWRVTFASGEAISISIEDRNRILELLK